MRGLNELIFIYWWKIRLAHLNLLLAWGVKSHWQIRFCLTKAGFKFRGYVRFKNIDEPSEHNNADPFFFCGWSNHRKWPCNRSKAPISQMEPVHNSTTFSRLSFSAWPGSGAPLSRDLEEELYKFWLIDNPVNKVFIITRSNGKLWGLDCKSWKVWGQGCRSRTLWGLGPYVVSKRNCGA